MPDKQTEHQYHQMSAAMLFQQVVEARLGDRSHVTPSDALLLAPLMRVVFTGASHREASEGACTEQELITRHKELCESGAFIEFLLEHYPRFHIALLEQRGLISRDE